MKALRVQTHQWVKTIMHDQRACPSCNLLAKCANRHHTDNLVSFKRLIIFYFQDSITRDDPIMFQLFSCVFVSCDLNQNMSNGTWIVTWLFVHVAFASHLIINLGCIFFHYEFNFILPPLSKWFQLHVNPEYLNTTWSWNACRIESKGRPHPCIIDFILPCDPCRNEFACIWAPTKLITLGTGFLIEINCAWRSHSFIIKWILVCNPCQINCNCI